MSKTVIGAGAAGDRICLGGQPDFYVTGGAVYELDDPIVADAVRRNPWAFRESDGSPVKGTETKKKTTTRTRADRADSDT